MKKILIFLVVFCVGFAWLSPNHIFPWVTAHSEFAIFLSLILLLSYTIIQHKQLVVYRINIIFIIIAVIPLIQFALQKIYFFGDALIASVYISAFFLALTIGNTIGQNEQKKKHTFQLISWIILFSAIRSLS